MFIFSNVPIRVNYLFSYCLNNDAQIKNPEFLAWQALENADIGVFKINMQTDEMEYSRIFARLLTGDEGAHFKRADFTGRVRPEDKYLRQAAYAEMLRTGKFHYEPTVIWKDGTEHQLRTNGTCNFDSSGKPLIFMGIVQDITNEKNNDQLEREWETRFSSIIEQSPVAMSLLRGPNLLIEVINQHMLSFIGRDQSIIGKPIKEALPEIHDQGFIEMMESVLKTGEPVYGNGTPAKLTRNNKTEELYFNFVLAPLKDFKGKIDGVIITAGEVTGQVKSRKALEESESRFRSLIEEAPVGTCLFVGKDMKVEVANDIMLGYWGVERSIMGLPFGIAVPEMQSQRFLKILDEVYTTGIAYEAKSAPADLKINGVISTYYFDFTYKPLRNEKGEVYAIMDMAVDVTDRVHATQQLEESELFSRNIIYNSPVAKLVFIGEDMVIKTINENMLRLIGRDESVIGKPFMEAIPELNSTPLMGRLRHVLKTGETFYQPEEKIDLIRFGKPHTGYYNYIYKVLHDTSGKNYGVIVTATEVTDQVIARQKIEEADSSLRGAIELADLGTWEVDVATGVMTFSDRMKEWFGLEPDDMVTTENSLNAVIEEDRHLLSEAFYHAIASHTNNIYDVEYTIEPQETGKRRILHAMGKAFFNDKGEPFKLSGTVQDVTTQRTLQIALEQEIQEHTEELQAVNEELMVTNEELAQLNQDLSYSNDELQQFAHVASHDLKEPLRKIKTFIDRIEIDKENSLTEKSKGFMEKVHAATNRMFSMIEGVLNYSTLNASEQKYQKIDLTTIINDILVDLEIVIARKQATINFGKLPSIEGAPILIYQLFYNLISNSLKFSRPDIPPVISIHSDITYKDDVLMAIIELRDNGIGFEQSEAEKIFNTFTRLNSKDKFEGTGLGLSLCKKIVLRHGGSISARGKSNEGSLFLISLPVRQLV